MERKITNFPYHINNSVEKINADDINKIESTINNVEKNIISLHEDDFKSKALFTLEHNVNVNAMVLDDFKVPNKIFFSSCKNIDYNQEESCVTLFSSSKITEGVFQTIKISTEHGAYGMNFILLVDEYVPLGSAIYYYLSLDGISFFPIKVNQGESTVIKATGNEIYIKAVIYKNKLFESPKLYGWALLYKDTIIDTMYSLSYENTPGDEVEVLGETILIRDKNKEDRVVAVISPDSYTQLFFGKDKHEKYRLSHVATSNKDKTITETLKYGDYQNSNGEIEEVL